jgi:hypothetical protein
MPRTLRPIASALLVAWTLFAASAPPAAALDRFGRPGHEGPSRPAEGREPGAFVSFLLRLFDLARGTMDPNGGP